MTNLQRDQIERSRLAGRSYVSIAAQLNMTVNAVKVYCSRHGLTDEAVERHRKTTAPNICPLCGKQIIQQEKKKPRRFCSDKCRYTWWNKNRDAKNKHTFITICCEGCRKEFSIYGNTKRRYCCHECYIRARFGIKETADDRRTIRV